MIELQCKKEEEAVKELRNIVQGLGLQKLSWCWCVQVVKMAAEEFLPLRLIRKG